MRTSTPSEIVSFVANTFSARLTPAIWGPPGIGKSDIIKQVCTTLGLKMIDLRLSQLEATDLNGIPERANERLVWLPPAAIPLDTDPLPQGFNGWLLFLDEINSANVEVQKAAYKLILDRMVGMFSLHPACLIAAAGNLLTDRAIVNKMPSTLQSRLIHFNLMPDVDEWMLWAERNEIDQRVIGFLRFSPDSLHRFDPNTQDNTFPCPRTWEFTSRLITGHKRINTTLIAGAVGEGTAVEFAEFVDTFSELPQFTDVIAQPSTAKIVKDAAVIYALFSLMISKINEDNVTQLVTYATRYPVEYQWFMVKQLRSLRDKAQAALTVPGNDKIYARISNVMRSDKIIAWMQSYAEKML